MVLGVDIDGEISCMHAAHRPSHLLYMEGRRTSGGRPAVRRQRKRCKVTYQSGASRHALWNFDHVTSSTPSQPRLTRPASPPLRPALLAFDPQSSTLLVTQSTPFPIKNKTRPLSRPHLYGWRFVDHSKPSADVTTTCSIKKPTALIHVTGVTDRACVGRIFAVYRCIRVTFSYVSDLTLLVHFPIKYRYTIPRHLHSRARRRAPYNESVKLPSFRRPLFILTTPRGLSPSPAGSP